MGRYSYRPALKDQDTHAAWMWLGVCRGMPPWASRQWREKHKLDDHTKLHSDIDSRKSAVPSVKRSLPHPLHKRDGGHQASITYPAVC